MSVICITMIYEEKSESGCIQPQAFEPVNAMGPTSEGYPVMIMMSVGEDNSNNADNPQVTHEFVPNMGTNIMDGSFADNQYLFP